MGTPCHTRPCGLTRRPRLLALALWMMPRDRICFGNWGCRDAEGRGWIAIPKHRNWARFGGKDIHPDLVAPLNRIPSGVLKLVKPRVTQGAGNARASKGTHLGGYCVDISTRTLAGSTIRRIIAAFEAAGFAAALRLPGDAGPSEHIHAALRPHANAEAVWRATRPGGISNIEKKLKARGR